MTKSKVSTTLKKEHKGLTKSKNSLKSMVSQTSKKEENPHLTCHAFGMQQNIFATTTKIDPTSVNKRLFVFQNGYTGCLWGEKSLCCCKNVLGLEIEVFDVQSSKYESFHPFREILWGGVFTFFGCLISPKVNFQKKIEH